MKIKISTIALLISLVLGCGNSVPCDVLQPKQMEEVLMDLIVVDSYSDAVSTLNSRDKKVDWLSKEADKVLKIRNISKDKFLKSYNFYKGRPDLLKVIVDTLQVRAQRNKDKIYDMKRFKEIE
jgi:hypothetical protein